MIKIKIKQQKNKWKAKDWVLFGVYVLICVAVLLQPSQNITKASAPISEPNSYNKSMKLEQTKEEFEVVEVIDFNSLDYKEKRKLIVERLQTHNLTAEQIDTFYKIFRLESCRNPQIQDCFDTRKVPSTTVYHCRRDNGTYHAIELINRNGLMVQARCEDYGSVQTGSEQSIGMAQILVSTWRGYQCEGDIRDYDWEQQVDCAVKIYKQSGFGAWSTYRIIPDHF
jgi:hypothetical protein